MTTVTLRERRQITLPAEVVTAAGIQVNDELDVRVVCGVIQMVPRVGASPQRPKMSRFLGAATGVYGGSAEESDAYVRQQRDSW
ncbi:MAG: AbrB/MazE/SpoVT family DNA-binding domain-containing protein [Rubrivivax sp.]|nr:AbrB/MazE/SpoVT family DNA-binding domain-containing protein [Rubrivivax sp.]